MCTGSVKVSNPLRSVALGQWCDRNGMVRVTDARDTSEVFKEMGLQYRAMGLELKHLPLGTVKVGWNWPQHVIMPRCVAEQR